MPEISKKDTVKNGVRFDKVKVELEAPPDGVVLLWGAKISIDIRPFQGQL